MQKYYLKIGGSLMENISRLKHFLEKLIVIFGDSFIVNVGSGYLGEMYKQWVSVETEIETTYDVSVENWAMIQLINANIITTLNKNYIIGSSSEEIKQILRNKKVAIINPVSFSKELAGLKLNTSDLKAAHLCYKFNCTELLIFTDVDGIYSEDPNASSTAQKISMITSDQLSKMGKTSVDAGIAELITKYHMKCRVCGVEEFLSASVTNLEEFLKCGTVISEGGI